jgi:hypothetical protein
VYFGNLKEMQEYLVLFEQNSCQGYRYFYSNELIANSGFHTGFRVMHSRDDPVEIGLWNGSDETVGLTYTVFDAGRWDGCEAWKTWDARIGQLLSEQGCTAEEWEEIVDSWGLDAIYMNELR